jgi:ribosome-associated translation inhibitor RaiA
MEIEIPGDERIESLRSYIRRQLRSRVGPYAHRIPFVSVRLSEYCGAARGVVLTKCRLEADVRGPGETAVGEALEANPYRAVDSATDALCVALARELESGDVTGAAARDASVVASAAMPAALDGQAPSATVCRQTGPPAGGDSVRVPSATPWRKPSWQSA